MINLEQATNRELFHYYCKDLPSPDLFIDYNFYFMVSSCLARKVWVGTEGHWQIFPNTYVIFVADPGIGKSIVSTIVNRILGGIIDLIVRSGEKPIEKHLVKLAPDTISFEKLVMRLKDSEEFILFEKPGDERLPYRHTSCCFCLGEELGTLFRSSTEDIVTLLVKAWDCYNVETDTIKRGVTKIVNVCINFLGCTSPEKVGRLLNSGLLEDGFTARVLFIYSNVKRLSPTLITTITDTQAAAIKKVKQHLKKLCLLEPGEVKLTPESEEWLNKWDKDYRNNPINPHAKLRDYYSRKKQHLIKMAINIHFADSLTMILTVEDFKKALVLLERAELEMHKAISGMGKNPVYLMSEQIKDTLRQRGKASEEFLQILHFSDGDKDMIRRALNYLYTSRQISQETLKGRTVYKLTGKYLEELTQETLETPPSKEVVAGEKLSYEKPPEIVVRETVLNN